MASLTAGIGTAIITPPVGIEMGAWVLRRGLCRGVHDDMLARALVLDDGETAVALVSLDVAGVSEEMTEMVRDLVAAQIPLPRSHILLNCSHTHTTPHTGTRFSVGLSGLTAGHQAYLVAFPHYVAGAIIEAWRHREPAAIGAASMPLPGLTVNRRDPQLPVDPELGVIRVDGEDGHLLACLVNYACHGTAVGAHDLAWTADFPGYLARAVEDAEPDSVCLFLQGAEGDIHPWDWYFGNPHPRYGDHYEGAERLGKALAGAACSLLSQIETAAGVELRFLSETISLPARPITWSADEAEAYLARLEAETPAYDHEVIPDGCPGCMSAQTFPDLLFGARHEAAFARRHPSELSAEINVLRIGDIILATNPGELFVELGLELKRRSPYAHTFVLSLTNGSIMYLPTRDAAEAVLHLPLEEFVDPVAYRNQYGATITTEAGPAAGEILVDATLRLIEQV
jgi:neutral ceramidase